MLLSKIEEEMVELKQIIGDKELFGLYDKLVSREEEEKNILLALSIEMRKISRTQVVLEYKKFKSKIVQEYADTYLKNVTIIFEKYDMMIEELSLEEKKEGEHRFYSSLETLGVFISCLRSIISEVFLVWNIIERIMQETWEPLPDNTVEENVNNIIVSSETRSMSLNDVSSDVDYLDRFFNSICSLIGQDKNEDNSIYLRKVETGSLTIAVSCVIGTAPIIAFMFWVIKLCQDTAERTLNIEEKSLNNKEKKLKIINDEIDIAKKILEIKSDNKQVDELIQGCAIHFWDFLENNPTGTINGKHYDIGIEKPKIEDKENK